MSAHNDTRAMPGAISYSSVHSQPIPQSLSAGAARPNGFTNGNVSELTKMLDENQPGRQKALDGISLRAFLIGNVLSLSITASITLIYMHLAFWRASFFLAILSTFHFLEYYVTARYNTRFANISAFLLSQNGRAYNAAHTAAFTECIICSWFFPGWQFRLSNNWTIAVGIALIFLGQSVRTVAMAHAGTNFNHTVQVFKAQGHVLVKDGIYRYLRHPSYFGFFWWGLGTQLVLGNALCFCTYAGVLWVFFSTRIKKEEELLVKFFSDEYEQYRRATPVGIPFVA